jgi:integrase/recombinase XerD
MKCVINDQVVLSRALEGPLGPHIGAFAESRSALGYARWSMQREVRLAAGFSRWLKHEGIALRHVGGDHVSRYLRDRARQVRPHRGDAAGLRHLLDFLRREGVIAAEKIPARRLSPAEGCAQEYARYLQEARALAGPTIVNYVPFIRGFLTDRFGSGPVRLARLTAGDVVRFVRRRAPQLHLKRAKLLTSALRSFLRYARYRGAVTLDLAAAVPVVANWCSCSHVSVCAPVTRSRLSPRGRPDRPTRVRDDGAHSRGRPSRCRRARARHRQGAEGTLHTLGPIHTRRGESVAA